MSIYSLSGYLVYLALSKNRRENQKPNQTGKNHTHTQTEPEKQPMKGNDNSNG